MNPEILSLRKDSGDVDSILLYGRVHRYGEQWAAIPREVVTKSGSVEAVIFEIKRLNDVTFPSLLHIFASSIRFESFSLVILPFLALTFYGFRQGWVPHYALGFAALLGAIFLQVSVYALSEVRDHLRLIPYLGLSKIRTTVIQRGWLNADQLQKGGYGAFLVGVLLGLPVVWSSPSLILPVGVLGVLGSFGYTRRPVGVKYRALGEFLIFFLFGPLLSLGLSQALYQKIDSCTFILGLFFGFLACTLPHASHMQELADEPSVPVFTLASILGFKSARHVWVGFYISSYTVLGLAVFLGYLPRPVFFAAAFGIPYVLRFLVSLYRASGPFSPFMGQVHRQAHQIYCLLSGLTALGFGFGAS